MMSWKEGGVFAGLRAHQAVVLPRLWLTHGGAAESQAAYLQSPAIF